MKSMKTIIGVMLLSLILMMTSACVGNVRAPSNDYSAPSGNFTLPQSLRNGPSAINGFTKDINVTVSIGGQTTPIQGETGEYYMITNAGDATTKPKITLSLSRPEYDIRNTDTGAISKTVVVLQGQTIILSKEDNVPGPVDFTLLTKPAAALPTSLTLSSLNVEPMTAGNFRIYRNSSDNNTAPNTLDRNSVYMQIGLREYRTGSYRLIGFGYAATGNNQPVMIGYKEAGQSGQTWGDFIVAARKDSNAATPATVLLTVAHDGQVLITKDPTAALGVATKQYVDAKIPAAAVVSSPTLYDFVSAQAGATITLAQVTKTPYVMGYGAYTLDLTGLKSTQMISVDFANFGTTDFTITVNQNGKLDETFNSKANSVTTRWYIGE